MSDFVKICPKCGDHNPEGVNTCQKCSHFLGMVRPVPRPAPPSEEPVPEISPAPETIMAPAEPTPEALAEPATDSPDLYVECLSTGRTFQVRPGFIVGRRDETSQADVQLEGAPGLNFVSREHCRFLFEDGAWFVVSLRSAMNGASVNQREIAPGARAKVDNGDTLTLANVPFRIRIMGR